MTVVFGWWVGGVWVVGGGVMGGLDGVMVMQERQQQVDAGNAGPNKNNKTPPISLFKFSLPHPPICLLDELKGKDNVYDCCC